MKIRLRAIFDDKLNDNYSNCRIRVELKTLPVQKVLHKHLLSGGHRECLCFVKFPSSLTPLESKHLMRFTIPMF